MEVRRSKIIDVGAAATFVLCLCMAGPARAQGDPPPPTTETRAPGLFKDLGHDVKGLGSTSSVTWLGAGLAASLAALTVDDYVRDHFSDDPGTEEVFEAGEILGGVPVQAGTALVVYTLGKTLHRPVMAAVGADLVRGHLIAQAITQGIKFSVQRTRPDGTRRSFPSGHSSTTFATATVLHRYFGWKLGAPSYALAAYVAASRVQSSKHYLSDVVFGATIGIVVGQAVTVGHSRTMFTPVPVVTRGSASINFVDVPLDRYVERLINSRRGSRF